MVFLRFLDRMYARFAVMLVFPTPPFPLVIEMTRLGRLTAPGDAAHPGESAVESAMPPPSFRTRLISLSDAAWSMVIPYLPYTK
jgi:hypothetical protein